MERGRAIITSNHGNIFRELVEAHNTKMTFFVLKKNIGFYSIQ
jgi:hypothetical protein